MRRREEKSNDPHSGNSHKNNKNNKNNNTVPANTVNTINTTSDDSSAKTDKSKKKKKQNGDQHHQHHHSSASSTLAVPIGSTASGSDIQPKVVTARIIAVESSSPSSSGDKKKTTVMTVLTDDPDNDHEMVNLLSNDEPTAVVAAQPMVEVVAPATLTEGYQFPATAAGRTFMVSVPKGGVKAGEKFSIPLPPETECIHPRVQVPVGHWKDGFWDLFSYGCCHPTVLHSCCCTTIAAGQTITRLQLTWLGQHTHSVAEASSAFRKLLLLVIVYWMIRAMMFYTIANLDPNARFDGTPPDYANYQEPSNWYYFACFVDDLIWYTYYAFCVYLLKNIRGHLRSKYAIPETQVCCTGCEDVACSLICPCFTAAQMLRHTTDYDMYDAKCCSSTGLPSYVPSIV